VNLALRFPIMMFGGFFGAHLPQGPFSEHYRAFPVSFVNKEDKESGDKIILPASAFERLAQMTVTYPMQFELLNNAFEVPRRTHVGVLEFTAPEGQCYLPYWIMQNLLLAEGDIILVSNVTLPVCNFVKFRPRSVDFLEISNPKAVLESCLRNFSCLTKDDQIRLPYNGKNYFIDIVELKPANAVSIVEADVNVDFEPPVGYVEPTSKPASANGNKQSSAAATNAPSSTTTTLTSSPGKALGGRSETAPQPSSTLAELAKAREDRKRQLEGEKAGYVSFSGSGRRVDGKVKGVSSSPPQKTQSEPVPVVADTAFGSSKWKQRTKGAAFVGEGNKLG
jgi:ubiquitin fusion degradation protein 1